jgi:SAM-dependent methyltransferase
MTLSLVGYTKVMNEQTLALLVDLHTANPRQGPGSPKSFATALALSGVDTTKPLTIADIGCGTGSATLPLLRETNGSVVAVDFMPAFLEKLRAAAEKAGVADRLTTLEADMNFLPFTAEQFDLIWSEGAIYTIGFQRGINDWKQYLKPNGVLVVSEITWLQPLVPDELRDHWQAEYPEVALASEKIAQLEQSGYQLLGYFPLPTDCWLEHYYQPLQASFCDFLNRHQHSATAESIIAAEEKEIALYKKYQAFVSYGMYVAKKVS